VVLAACSPGGEYVKSGHSFATENDRGETNGRMFDFVSNKPDGDDWQIRIRGSSLWASYAKEDKTDPLGNANLTEKETRKIWQLIDNLNLADRKKGKKDEDEGYVELRLREPTDEQHELITRFITRATEDEDVVALAEYLQDLIKKYFKEKPNF